jgi:hypothetical protein
MLTLRNPAQSLQREKEKNAQNGEDEWIDEIQRSRWFLLLK